MNVHSHIECQHDLRLHLAAFADDGRDRRAHILAAAERAFVRYGFHAATMKHVADEAGMSAGNLYRYFPLQGGDRRGAVPRRSGRALGSFAALAERAQTLAPPCAQRCASMCCATPPKRRA